MGMNSAPRAIPQTTWITQIIRHLLLPHSGTKDIEYLVLGDLTA
ncbi:MAG: hypothetical protein ACFWTR_27060 [Pseudomonas shahriarae]|jgi:hypothetical protein